MNIAVVGSGLASIAACKALISRGIKPTVLDIGKCIDEDRLNLATSFSEQNHSDWKTDEMDFLFQNSMIDSAGYPRKLSFGSSFFYGDNNEVGIQSDSLNGIAPFSFAAGGFSNGWAGSILAPHSNDIATWPIKNKDLDFYYKKVLDGLPYSGKMDSLASEFSLISKPKSAITLNGGAERFLRNLSSRGRQVDDEIFGQSRLLVESTGTNINSCRYCGQCMSGCVYGAIYKSSDTLNELISKNLISYIKDIKVTSFSEKEGCVDINAINILNGKNIQLTFDRLLIGAGALNSTKIVMQSLGIFNVNIPIKTTVSFLAPLINFKGDKINWEKTNTLPNIFYEYKERALSDHWIHAQISTPNELVLKKIGILNKQLRKPSLYDAIKLRLIDHLLLAQCNLHSDHGNHFELMMMKDSNSSVKFLSNRLSSRYADKSLNIAIHRFKNNLKGTGYIIPTFLIQKNTSGGGFHIGGSMPMSLNSSKILQTNIFGAPNDLKRVNVIDSSIFPSIPSTTLGLLIMANAYRIADQINLEQKKCIKM